MDRTFCYNKTMPEKPPESAETIPEVLSGKEVANIAAELYQKIPRKFGAHFVEPGFILTMAGFKPNTELFHSFADNRELDEVKEDITTINSLLKERGIEFGFVGEAEEQEGKKMQMFTVENLRGYERESKTTKIPGVARFESKDGFDGLMRWTEETVQGLEEAQKRGEIPQNFDLMSILQGINKGYPDIVIYDFAKWEAEGGGAEKIVSVQIPYVDIYEAPHPTYIVSPEHLEDPEVRRNIEEAGKILKEFYESDWHQRVSREPDFKAQKPAGT